MIPKSPVTICIRYLSAKGELMHLHDSIFGFNKYSSQSNVFKKGLKLKILVDKGKPSLYVTIGIGNSIDVGKAEEISGSHRMRGMFMSSTPLLS